jgi:hypothetical protein
MNELTRALYEAHVAHELRAQEERSEGDGGEHEKLLTSRLFMWLSVVKLDDVLTPEQVLAVIDRYVINLRISGGIAELAGQMTQMVFASDISADTRLDQLLSYESYRGFADKIEGLEAAQRELIQLLVRTRSFRPLMARAITLAARTVLLEQKHKEGASEPDGRLSQLSRELKEDLLARAELQLNRYFERHADELVKRSESHLRELVTPDTLRSLADELWDAVAGKRLSELFSFVSASDLEDFVVLAYETWLHYRQTPYFRDVCRQVVFALFEQYGPESVQTLLDDMGVTEEMVAHELHALVAPMVNHAAETGFYERLVRARLEPFYRSGDVVSLLAQRG